MKKAERQANKKKYSETHADDCGCGACITKWMYFDNNYFNELSRLVDNNLIKTVQNDTDDK